MRRSFFRTRPDVADAKRRSRQTLRQNAQSVAKCNPAFLACRAHRTRNVKRWNNSDQRYRWLATALLDIEPRLRRIKGFRFLPALRLALRKELKLDLDTQDAFAAD